MSFIRNNRTTKGKSQGSIEKRYAQVIGVLLLGTLIGSMVSVSTTSAMAATSSSSETFKLAIIPLAPKLPADGNSYPIMIQLQTAKDSHPIEAPYDIAITLLTSDETVLLPQSNVMLKTGQSLVSTTLSTTSKAGVVGITAVAQGVKSDVANIETLRPGSLDPTKLALYAGASSFIPNPAYPGKMYVQLLNAGGIPAITDKALTIYLSSGDSKVGSVPKYVTIQKGTTGTIFDFTPTNQLGKTSVTASANGLAPAQTSVKTDGAAASKLVIEFAPPSMPAPVGFNSMFTVQLRDSDDNPVLAKQAISIGLSSSDTNIAKAPSYLTIEQGQSYASGKIESNGNVGSAIITASAQGLASGTATINAVAYVQANDNAPKEIGVYTIPSQIVANNDEKALVIVQVTDNSGNVYTSKSYLYYSIAMSSSEADFGSVDKNLVTDVTYATTTFKSSFLGGKSTVSASASGYSTGSADITASGSVPASLKITQIPGTVLADNAASGAVIVSLFDAKGKPTVALQDVLVGLSSSNPEIASVEATEFIPTGKSYGQVVVHSTTKAGKATITAQAQGLAPGSLDFKTVGNTGDASQYKLGISTIPKYSADGKTYDSVFVQLQDSNGNPVSATSDIRVVLSVSSKLAGSVEENITIKQGSSFSTAKFTTSTTAAKFKLSASSNGFGTVETDQLETTVQPLTITPSSALPTRGQFGSIPVAIDVLASTTGLPLANATVQVGGLAANNTVTYTDNNGHIDSTYVPTQPGRNSIMFTVTKPGYEIKTASYGILLDQTVNVAINAVTQGGKLVPVQSKVSGPSVSKTLALGSATGGKIENTKWGSYKISVPDQFSTENAQYKFVQWSDGVKESTRTTNIISDGTFTAVYSAKYLVTVSSERGLTTGGGYYAEGQTATISVSKTSARDFLTESTFGGWTGDIKADPSTIQLSVDSPKTVKAQWNDNYILIFVLAGVAGAGGIVAYLKVLKPKKEAKEKARAPDLDWYKS
jgi:hypothetical protein